MLDTTVSSLFIPRDPNDIKSKIICQSITVCFRLAYWAKFDEIVQV